MSQSALLEDLIEKLSSLTVLEMSQLKEALENKWGVKAQAAAVMAPVALAGAPVEAAPESTEFEITLESVPADKKIGVIKILRELTGLGLKEAKELVDNAPKVVKEKAPKNEADDAKKRLEDQGAKVKLKGL